MSFTIHYSLQTHQQGGSHAERRASLRLYLLYDDAGRFSEQLFMGDDTFQRVHMGDDLSICIMYPSVERGDYLSSIDIALFCLVGAHG